MRLEVHTSTTGSGITLINDSYSADPSSLGSALRTLGRIAADRRSIAVLGAMEDLGAATEAGHVGAGRLVAELGIDYVVTVGARAVDIGVAAVRAGMTRDRVIGVADRDDCAQKLDELLAPGDVVLVKASRPLQLERTAEHLLESMSPTRAYIDLAVVADNLRRIRAWTGPGVAMMPVVKSFGYGSDGVRVSEVLQAQGVDYLTVAYPDEGIVLRRAGIHLPILVTSAARAEVDKLAKYRLTPVVYSAEVVDAFDEAAGKAGYRAPVHLKVDTGMGRFGVEASEALAFAQHITSRPNLKLEGLMSHLAVADDPAEDDYTRLQLARFTHVVNSLRGAGIEPALIHLANSAGLVRFPEAQFNAVRPGLALYGFLDGAPAEAGPALEPAISLHSRLVGVRQLDEGQAVGYGGTFVTKRKTRLGLVGLGYNDGLPRAVSNRGAVQIRGKRAPIAGNVCMDVTLVDITDIPDARAGDDVVVYGSGEGGEPTAAEVADWSDTIVYEVLCRISPRVRRIVRLP